jgi:hypothetical protein
MSASTPEGFPLWLPSRLNATVWAPPGGWDSRWSPADTYAAAVARESCLRQGYSEADSGTMAVMYVNMRNLHGIQYPQIWMAKMAAARLTAPH